MVSQESLYPNNVGVVALDIYFPQTYVEQSELEKYDGVSEGKYTIGLGQNRMAFVSDREDIQSICLTVVQNVIEKYGISYNDIGRMEVGTETIIDKSKSVKSTLMSLFAASGNTDIEGIDTTNACYGGTSAVFNAIHWVESSAWDGRFALVVAGDIAVYAGGSARPTGGAGVVALLIGPDAPLVFERGLRGTHMEHVYDFYKPELSSEFPEVDGQLSIACYLRSLDRCYERYLAKLEAKEGVSGSDLEIFDYILFHSPFTKLVQKSFARLMFNDFLRNPDDEKYGSVQQFRKLKLEDTYFNKEVEKAFVALSKPFFNEKTTPSLVLAKELGNTYCGSVYASLVSLVGLQGSNDKLLGKRLALFSYGSGSAASLFSIRVTGSLDQLAKTINLSKRLASRKVMSPGSFTEIMQLREETHNLKNYQPKSPIEDLFPGTYYLQDVDEKYRRTYGRTEKLYI